MGKPQDNEILPPLLLPPPFRFSCFSPPSPNAVPWCRIGVRRILLLPRSTKHRLLPLLFSSLTAPNCGESGGRRKAKWWQVSFSSPPWQGKTIVDFKIFDWPVRSYHTSYIEITLNIQVVDMLQFTSIAELHLGDHRAAHTGAEGASWRWHSFWTSC